MEEKAAKRASALSAGALQQLALALRVAQAAATR